MPDTQAGARPGTPMGHVELQILLALRQGPRHGYELMQEIARATAGGISPGPGTLYVALRRLSSDGRIRELASRPDDARQRRRYALAASGRAALSAELDRLGELLRRAEWPGMRIPKGQRA